MSPVEVTIERSGIALQQGVRLSETLSSGSSLRHFSRVGRGALMRTLSSGSGLEAVLDEAQ